MEKLKRCTTEAYPDQAENVGNPSIAIQEADHRIGNSLAFLSAMLRLESRHIKSVDSARHALLNAASRLNAVSRLHFALAANGHDGTVDLNTNLTALGKDLSESLDIDLKIACDDLQVKAEVAGGLAVAISELATNALKHRGTDGKVVVMVEAFQGEDGGLCVLVGDNGAGLPDDFDMKEGCGLGMTIIASTIQRLHGTVEPVPDPTGAMFRIDLPN